MIVYDEDENHTTPRIKIGNGEQTVNQLPFIDEEILNKFNEFSPIGVTEEEEGHIVFEGVYYGNGDFEERLEALENGKVDKVLEMGNNDAGATYVMGTAQYGVYEPLLYRVENTPVGGRIVKFDKNGRVRTNTPSEDNHCVNKKYLENNTIQAPTMEQFRPECLLGIGKNDNKTKKILIPDIPQPNAVAIYNSQGMLLSRYYDRNLDAYTYGRVLTESELWQNEFMQRVSLWCYTDEEGIVHTDYDDFDMLCASIYDNYAVPVLHIETDTYYKQVLGAYVQWDAETGDYASITFGNEYILYRDSDILEKIEEHYELIETITLEEETAQLVRTQEPDGTPYKFKRVYILFVGNQAGGSAGVVGFYNQKSIIGSYYVGGITTPTQYCSGEIRQEAGSWRTTWSDWTTNSTVVHGLRWGNDYGYYPQNSIKDYPCVDEIIFYNTLPAGTEIKIWGVRA